MKQPKVEFFKDTGGKWRWRMIAKNGRILCEPGESFSSKNKAQHNLQCVLIIFVNGYQETECSN
jgi:uncharacterized protein YegP (UPF0339 family)